MGAMLNEANAEKLKQRLEQLGYPVTVRKGVANVRRHMVTVGDFPERAGAEDLAKRLTAQGMRGRAIQAGGRYVVEAGSFASEDDAIDLARALQKLNHQARIQDVQQNSTLYLVRVGSYGSRDEARAKGSELEGKGFRYFIVKN
jgi:cell division protein FtsN